MSNPDNNTAKPRIWLRIFLVLMLLIATAATLGYKKFQQIQEMAEQGSLPPPPISVTVGTAVPAEWNRQVKAVGTMVAHERVAITSEIDGVIKSIYFSSGQEVVEASLLVELDNRTELASLEAARARLSADKSRYQRLLKLRDQSFASSNDIDDQAALVEISEAEVNVARAALDKKRIFAPFSGKLGLRQVDHGEFVSPGEVIVSLQSLDKLLLDFSLPESNYQDLAVNQLVHFKVRSYPDRVFEAKVQAWNPVLDESTRNISVRAEVDNHERLLAPGMFAEMQVTSKRKQPVLTMAETAIFYNIYGEAVYILEKIDSDSETAESGYRLAARQVKVAYRQDGVAGISEGINAGDQVVTAGQLKLYPGLRVAVVDDVPEFGAAAN